MWLATPVNHEVLWFQISMDYASPVCMIKGCGNLQAQSCCFGSGELVRSNHIRQRHATNKVADDVNTVFMTSDFMLGK